MLEVCIAIILISSFFVLFRYFPKFGVVTFHAIVVNYTVCVTCGLLFFALSDKGFSEFSTSGNWIPIAAFIGFMFIGTFNLMAETVTRISVSVSSIANKTSLVLPVGVSLIMAGAPSQSYSWVNFLGIGMALPAIVCASWKPKAKDSIAKGSKWERLLLPALVFFLGGIIDSFVNYFNLRFKGMSAVEYFPLIAFTTAALTGWVVILTGRTGSISYKSMLGGIALGIPNYFSLYYLVEALQNIDKGGTLVFPVLNVGIILMTTLCAWVLFKERLSLLNVLGIVLSIASIVLVFY